MRRARAASAAFALSAVVFGASAATASALPASFWGVVPQGTPTESQFALLGRGGVGAVRIPMVWSEIEPEPGVPRWETTDELIRGATAVGLEVLPFVTGAPSWAVPSRPVPGDPSAEAPGHLPAAGAAASAWSSFLAELVERYGPGGAFWTANPSLVESPIRTWQVWNEENFKYFVTKPNPAEYGKLVKLSYGAIRAVDPGASILLGGMFSYPKGGGKPGACMRRKRPTPNLCAPAFLQQMYRKTPGVKGKFSGVALHPYAARYQLLSSYIEEFRQVLSENHDAGKGLWITELGWSSEPPSGRDAFAKGPVGQAKQLRGAFSLLKRKQAKWRIRHVYWFSVDDEAGACNFCGGSGLFGAGFKPKKAWYEYARFAGGAP
jgi:polysaccharide biosynthesis protein PslG